MQCSPSTEHLRGRATAGCGAFGRSGGRRSGGRRGGRLAAPARGGRQRPQPRPHSLADVAVAEDVVGHVVGVVLSIAAAVGVELAAAGRQAAEGGARGAESGAWCPRASPRPAEPPGGAHAAAGPLAASPLLAVGDAVGAVAAGGRGLALAQRRAAVAWAAVGLVRARARYVGAAAGAQGVRRVPVSERLLQVVQAMPGQTRAATVEGRPHGVGSLHVHSSVHPPTHPPTQPPRPICLLTRASCRRRCRRCRGPLSGRRSS